MKNSSAEPETSESQHTQVETTPSLSPNSSRDSADPGTTDSVTSLYEKHFKKLVGDLTAAFGPGPPEPEDIAQRAFEKFLRQGSAISRIRHIQRYLWRTAHNLLVSDLRSRAAAERRDYTYSTVFLRDEHYLLTPERVFESEEAVSVALATLQKMPSRRRTAFELVRLEGLSHAEAARQMGISRGAVTQYVAKATNAIYVALADAQGDQ